MDSDTKDRLKSDHKSLNIYQKRVVNKTSESVVGVTSLKMTVSGSGGRGQSRLFTVVRRLVSKHFKKEECPVVVLAPAGLAAHSISGVTIYRCLS